MCSLDKRAYSLSFCAFCAAHRLLCEQTARRSTRVRTKNVRLAPFEAVLRPVLVAAAGAAESSDSVEIVGDSDEQANATATDVEDDVDDDNNDDPNSARRSRRIRVKGRRRLA